MLLRKLYSEPEGLFGAVEFKEGINFIFGEKSSRSDPKRSLNGIGKSTLLDLIDFCLLSSYASNHSPRLFSAKELLSKHFVVLEVEINNKGYVIKRSVDDHNKVFFGELGENDIQEYSRIELGQILCDLVFKRKGYAGTYSNKLWRKIIPFFVKIQSQKKDNFSDPIRYIKQLKITELNQYIFFLLGLDNKLVSKNFDIQNNLKKRTSTIREIKELVEHTYGFKDISEASDKIDKINQEINGVKNTISQFKLARQYEDVEKNANDLTAQIKELWFQNFSARKRIESYQSSLKLNIDIDIPKIKGIYSEFNKLFGDKIAVTLGEAIKFRKSLIESRKNFISSELSNLRTKISEGEEKITKLEQERAKLFSFLSGKEAIKDLSEAYLLLSKKQDEQGELEGKIRLYSDLQKEKADLKIESTKMEKKFMEFVDENSKKISSFRQILNEIYDAIYPESKTESIFTLNIKPQTDAIVNIDINFPAMYSKGRNQGRTLVFDLSTLFHSIKQKFPGPRFLIHDGIFDGVDKAHFVYIYKYLEKLKTTARFQYIVTLNEEGTLNQKFGEVDDLTPKKISAQAISVLSPTKKLFGKKF